MRKEWNIVGKWKIFIGVSCALMLVGILGCDGLLTLINTPEEVFADSALYLDIYVLGLPFMFFYNIATGIFSALGDSKTPFYFLAVSSLSNIGVDILFVTAGGMGVDGVAWATFLCQGISCLCAMAAVLHFEVDAIVYTGGMAYEQFFCDDITAYVGRLAPVLRFPGEEEMRALAEGALRVLHGEAQAERY